MPEISDERKEEIKRMVVSFLQNLTPPRCIPMSRLAQELRVLYPESYPTIGELYELRFDPEFDFLKKGLYMTGVLTDDVLCLKGEAEKLMPMSPAAMYERIEHVYEKVSKIEGDVEAIKKELRETHETVEDIYYDIQKIKVKLAIKGKKKKEES